MFESILYRSRGATPAQCMATHAYAISLISIVGIGAARALGQSVPCPPNNFAALPVDCGESVVSCFGGFLNNNPGLGLDPNGYVLALVDTRNPPPPIPGGLNWCTGMWHNDTAPPGQRWTAANLGQIFGVTLDDATPPNIYVSASTVYGGPGLYSNCTSPLPTGGLSIFGPGGSGGVYKINGGTGAISVLVRLPNGVWAGGASPANFSQTGPALGDLAFDRLTQTIFVSNFNDGLIYALNPTTGAIKSAFKHQNGGGIVGPGTPTNAGTNTFAAKTGGNGEGRPWGLGVLNGRLYYGLWKESVQTPTAQSNEVWSVAITTSATVFSAGSALLEFSLTPYLAPCNTNPTSSPVAGIAFSNQGNIRMMLSERTICGDVGAAHTNGPAHVSRVLEYGLVGSTWTSTLSATRQFNIGVFNNGCNATINSAGGSDYFCDDRLISTGDFLATPGGGVVYGLQITPAAGNAPPPSLPNNVRDTGVFIDLNNSYTTLDKTQIGDVIVNRNCCDNHCPAVPPNPTVAVDQRCGDLAKNVAHYSIDTLGDPNNPGGYVSVGQQVLPSGFTGLHVVCWDRDGKIVVERLFQTGVASESIVGTSVDVDANCNIIVAGRAVAAGVWSTFVLKLDSKLLPICGTRIPAPTSPAGTTVEANVDVQADWLQDGSIAVYDRLKIGTETQSRITRLANNCSLIWMQRYGSLQASPGQFIIHDIEQEPVAPFDLWACGAMAWSNGGPSEILPMVMKIPVATGVCNATNLRAYDFPPLTPWITGRFTAIKFNPTTGPNLNEAIVAGWSVKPGSGPFGTPVGVARIAAINPALAQRFDTLYSNANFLTATSAISMAKGKPAPNAIVIAGTSAFAGFGEATGWTLSADQATGAHIVTVRHALPNPGSYQWSFGDITPGANRATIGAYSDLSPFQGGSKLWFNQHACQTLFSSGIENVAPFPLFTGELFCNAWDIVTPLPMVEVPVLSPCFIDCKFCYPDCDFSGNLSIDDFICFITLFALSDPYADCDGDGTLGIDDFICFQTFFAIGC